MGDFPVGLFAWSHGSWLSTADLGSPGETNRCNGATYNNTANFGSKVVIYQPVVVPFEVTVFQMGIGNGATVSGNVDVGIMDQFGTRLVSIGAATAQAGISQIQTFDITNTTLVPGTYYFAFSQDNATGLVNRSGSIGAQLWRTAGCRQETTVAFGIPATAAFAAYSTNGSVPLVVGAISSATF